MKFITDKKVKLADKGFTLIESIAVIFVFALIFGVVSASIVMIYQTQGYSIQQSMAIDEARRGVEVMASEIRQANYGENGAYPIEMGAGKEFIFYSDVDADGTIEKVRYFLATVNSGSDTGQCSTNSKGGSCNVNFTNFLTGTLKSAQLKVSVEGDLGSSNETASVYIDGSNIDTLCVSGCNDCAAAWQGVQTYDITSAAQDDSVQVMVDGSNQVDPGCSWGGSHSLKAQFEFSFVEEIPNVGNQLKRGVIEPSGVPPVYLDSQEEVKIITSYVRNAPPIFTYFDKDGNQIILDPAILRDTKMMKLFMVINIDPNRPPGDYDLEQYVQLRNLKEE
ncbi:MAG TPA: type II secretion system protein [Candidatus Paceibacterota bacterium]|nr:type II secretion system protein [Candidatus Pacearchaeota archaeon]HRZ51311.1 type II secretion system protein [Candidatus Paceibacterota bacterium]HSA37033.1 type II secretion system protein [Candidatus Paceibacterota bacterium]